MLYDYSGRNNRHIMAEGKGVSCNEKRVKYDVGAPRRNFWSKVCFIFFCFITFIST